MAVRTSVAGASDTPESPNPGQIGPVPGDPERKWREKRPVEAARQASPYLYPSGNPPLHCPDRASRPSGSSRPRALAPSSPTRHRSRTRSAATSRSHPDCRNVLILIVAGQEEPFLTGCRNAVSQSAAFP